MDSIKKYDFLTQSECEILINVILSLENEIKELGPDNYPGTNPDSLTGRYLFFNFLHVDIVNSILVPKLRKLFGPCVVQCWANSFRKGEGIREHAHVDKDEDVDILYASANLFLCGDPNIGTYYNGIKHVNKPGQFTVFSRSELHHVPKNPTNDIRISMAMDIYKGSEDMYKDMLSDQPWRLFHID
jgi:hypothetical protein